MTRIHAQHKVIGRALIVLMLIFAFQAAGCSEVSISGKTAEDVFTNPQTLALVEAACNGDLAKVDSLVRQGANVNATGYRDTTPLSWVMLCRNYAGMQKLLELGANPNYKMEGDMSAVWLAAGGDDPKWLGILLAHGGNPNIRAGYRTALMIAIEQGRTANIQLLLDHGANVNEHDEGGNSAATQAAALSKFDVVLMLLGHGYNYNLQYLTNMVGVSAVAKHTRAETLKNEILDELASKGFRPNVVPHIGAPPPPPRQSNKSQ